MPESFDAFFKRLTGNAPAAYQRDLAERNGPPDGLAAYTGTGKTFAVVVSWLYQRRVLRRAPRRLVYALPMRTLVEQTAREVRRLKARGSPELDDLGVHVLMGGEPRPADDWRLRPHEDQILIGTIDMLLSRALNRGYAESRYAWPVSYGLLNNDCRWIFDEVQLMGPAVTTSAQLDGLRRALGTVLPCETMWVSATIDEDALRTVDRPELGEILTIPHEDYAEPGAVFHERVNADKRLERHDLSAIKAADQPRAIALLATERHVPGSRTLVVVNRVERAQAIYLELRRRLRAAEAAPDLVLLHSRFRRADRDRHMTRLTKTPSTAGTIAVATQVVEAGVDMSSQTLITDVAPFSSIVQRLGRCNRYGGDPNATAIWLDPGPLGDDRVGRALAPPYHPAELQATREALLELDGRSVSPVTLASAPRVYEHRDEPAVLRRRDLLDLFDTAPDLSGLDIDIAPFIRDDDERNVSAFFRDLGDDPPGEIAGQGKPTPGELVQVPLAALRRRTCWIADHLTGRWLRPRDGAAPPGSTVMLNARDGGYDDELGWSPRTARGTVAVVESDLPHPALERSSSDHDQPGQRPQPLLSHLEAVARETDRIVDALELDAWRDHLRTAAALHDVGKAHEVFQRTMRSVIDEAVFPDRDTTLWGKSGSRGGRHEREHFCHELASALIVDQLDAMPNALVDALVVYLIAAHHGRVRLSIQPAAGEDPPLGVSGEARYARGIVDGDTVEPVETPLGTVPRTRLDLGPMELGHECSWARRMLALRDDPELGPFRLGLLEALLRVADWRVSAAVPNGRVHA